MRDRKGPVPSIYSMGTSVFPRNWERGFFENTWSRGLERLRDDLATPFIYFSFRTLQSVMHTRYYILNKVLHRFIFIVDVPKELWCTKLYIARHVYVSTHRVNSLYVSRGAMAFLIWFARLSAWNTKKKKRKKARFWKAIGVHVGHCDVDFIHFNPWYQRYRRREKNRAMGEQRGYDVFFNDTFRRFRLLENYQWKHLS